jgi:PAS domain S-box-containing protein
MRDRDKTKEQLVADLERTRKQLNALEDAARSRNAALKLLSEMPAMIDDRRHWSGSWFWCPGSGKVEFERNLADCEMKPALGVKGWKVGTERWFAGEWEEIVWPDDLNSLTEDLKSILAGEENHPVFCFQTKDIPNVPPMIMATSCIRCPDEIVGDYVEPITFIAQVKKLKHTDELSKTFRESKLQDFLWSTNNNELVAAIMWDVLINVILKDYPDVLAIINNIGLPHYQEIKSLLHLMMRQNEALHAEISFLTSAIHRSHVAFFTKSEGKYSFVSPAFARLVGFSQAEIEGKTDLQLFGEGNTEDYEEILDYHSVPLRSKLVTINAGKTMTELMIVQMCEEDPDCPDDFMDWLLKPRILTAHAARLKALSGAVKSSRIPPSSWGLACIPDDVESRVESRGGVIEYESKAMRAALKMADNLAKEDCIVLITGESGSGKDYLARHIHNCSDRADGPYLSLNCAAIAPELAESELFGHEKGAFTGAVRLKRGLLELAQGGTLLLNEIGELSPALQSKLLTFLDTKKFTRVGGEKEISVTARLIAATNKDLDSAVKAGEFRKDLYYRLNVVQIDVPPLRDRPEDIPNLAQEFLMQLQKERGGPSDRKFCPADLQKLRDYYWEGNVRELRNVVERSLILAEGRRLKIDLPTARAEHEQGNELERVRQDSDLIWSVGFPPEKNLESLAKDMKRALIHEALRQAAGKKTEAARLLGISRDALYGQMDTLGISRGSKTHSPE